MPSLFHEGLLDLFRNRPSLAPEMLRDELHAPVPAFDRVRVLDAQLPDLVPTEFRADLVLLLEGPTEGAPRSALVVEAQLAIDRGKRWSWPVYVASLRARLRCEVALVVVTSEVAVARWASRPIPLGHPGFALTPLVLGPGSIPLVRDEALAARVPELAVLSALVHGHRPEAAHIARAALAGAREVDDERAALYIDLVFASVGEAVRRELEALMANGTYKYQSEFAKRYVAQGEVRGEARALLKVLEARGIALGTDARQRIEACTDLAMFDTWLTRAASAGTIEDVFELA